MTSYFEEVGPTFIFLCCIAVEIKKHQPFSLLLAVFHDVYENILLTCCMLTNLVELVVCPSFLIFAG